MRVRLRTLLLPLACLAALAILRPSAVPASAPRSVMVQVPDPETETEPLSTLADSIPEPVAIVPAWKAEIELRREVIQRMAWILVFAYVAMNDERYVRCQDLCEDILLVDPRYPVALELRGVALRLSHATISSRQSLWDYVAEFERQTDSDPEDPRIPLDQEFRIPDAQAWRVLSQCITSTPERGGSAEKFQRADISRTLTTMRLDLNFRDTTLEDILAFIRDASGLNLILDARVRDQVDPDVHLSIQLSGWTVGETLGFILSPLGMDYQVTEERVVLLTVPQAR